MEFVAKKRFYRETRKGKNWVTTKHEYHTEKIYGLNQVLRDYYYQKDININDAHLQKKDCR